MSMRRGWGVFLALAVWAALGASAGLGGFAGFGGSALAAGAPENKRDVMLLNGDWWVLGVLGEAAIAPAGRIQRIPPEANAARWPGPMQLAAAGDAPSSITVYLYYPLEAPRRWRGKAVWVRLPAVESPTRVYLNGRAMGWGALAGGWGAEVQLSEALEPGGSNLLVLAVEGAGQARRMLRGDPPQVIAAPPVHLSQLIVRPECDAGIIYVDAGLRMMPSAGVLKPPAEKELEDYRVGFSLREGPPGRPGAALPESAIRAVQIHPRQMSLTAPLAVAHPRLWTPSQPFLYSIRAVLYFKQAPVDSLEAPAGFVKWTIKEGRLNLHNRPVECRAIGIPGALARRAGEGAWAEAFPEAAKPGEAALEWTLDQAARKRQAFWEEALGRFKAAGFNLARTDASAPEALLEAADRIGMMVEQRVEPRLSETQARERGGLAAAYAAAEAVRRDQAHPSLAFWRVETRDSSARLSALAGAMRTLDPTRPVFGFLSSDQRLRRPGIVHIPGIAEAKAALETACMNPGQQNSLLWRLYSNSIDPEHPLPVKPVWFWAPVAGEIGALKPAELAGRLLFARANPLSAGCGAALAPPQWASDSAPLPTRLPKMRDFLAAFEDAETSAALAESLNAAQLIPDPSTQTIPLGRSTRLDLAWVFGRDQAPPAKAVLQFSIYHEKPGKSNGAASSSGPPRSDGSAKSTSPTPSIPPGSDGSAKSTSSIPSISSTPSIPSASPGDPPALATVERTVAPAQMSGGKQVCRFGVELEFSRDLPPGPAWLVVQARWENKILVSKPLEVTLAGR